jgi:putative phage-type endonuclease
MNAREEWLQQRQQGIGGSDAAAALGLSRFKTQYQLYLEKRGELRAEDLDGKEFIRFGNLMEEVIAREYARRNAVRVRRRNAILAHAKYPWMRANVDRLIEGQRTGLECKNVDAMAFRFGEWGEPGTDEVPDEYLFQCAHYMAVLDYPEWHLAACVGGNKLKTYIIVRDAELEEMLIEQEHAFWTRVQSGERPDPDYAHATTGALLKRLYPGTDASEISLGDIEHWHKVRRDASAAVKVYEGAIEAANNHILDFMGQAAIGRLPDGSFYRRKEVDRKGYVVEPTTYMDLRHMKPEKPKKAPAVTTEQEAA